MRRTERGMTLVEVTIAMAVVGVAILGAISVMAFSTSTDHAAKQRIEAMDAAKSIMERIQETAFDDVAATWNGFNFPVSNLPLQEGDGDGNAGRVAVDGTDPELLDVQVVVEWKGLGGSTNLVFRTLMTRK